MSLPNHRQKVLMHDGMAVPVDEGLADLLQALWALGMPTEFSCQNFGHRRRGREEPSGPHYGYIAFTHFEHAVRFVRESRIVFLGGDREPGLLSLETYGERAFVDFPAYKLLALTAYWRLQRDETDPNPVRNVSRETSPPVATEPGYA